MDKLDITRFPKPDYVTAEGLNTLVTNISYCGSDIRKIMVTSRHAGEGKSYVTMNLMRTLAGIGRRVVLVDTDLRASGIQANYRLRTENGKINGLTEYLSGLCMLALILFWCRTAPVQLKPVAVPPARLSLTPMQEKLMEMFRSAPGQTLTKEEICTALWPKKENPEDTLYTFMSRLKSSLKNQSSLQIVNRRGREYVLLDEDATA